MDAADGVTSFVIRCRASGQLGVCPGYGYSCFYQPPDDCGKPQWEWYTPSKKEVRRATKAQRDHYREGGLALRRIGGVGRDE